MSRRGCGRFPYERIIVRDTRSHNEPVRQSEEDDLHKEWLRLAGERERESEAARVWGGPRTGSGGGSGRDASGLHWTRGRWRSSAGGVRRARRAVTLNRRLGGWRPSRRRRGEAVVGQGEGGRREAGGGVMLGRWPVHEPRPHDGAVKDVERTRFPVNVEARSAVPLDLATRVQPWNGAVLVSWAKSVPSSCNERRAKTRRGGERRRRRDAGFAIAHRGYPYSNLYRPRRPRADVPKSRPNPVQAGEGEVFLRALLRWLEIEPNDRHEAVQPRPPLLAHAQPGKPPRQPSKESEGVGGPGAEGIEGTIADPCRIFPEGQQTQDQQCHASAHADRRDNDEQAVIDESAQHERSVRLLRRWIRRRDRVHQRQRRW